MLKNLSKNYILAIDQGTTGSRAILFDHKGKEKGRGYKEFRQYYPKPGWVEHDPNEIIKSVEAAIRTVLSLSKVNPRNIAAIGITNQRETTILWNRKTGVPYTRAIVWQDRRTAEICDELKKKKLEALVHSKTGLVLDPYFSGTKISWLLNHHSHLRQEARLGRLAFGTVDSWLLWKLTGEHATDHTNASRTLLFNIQTRKWDKDLLSIFSVPESILPKVQDSASFYGKTRNWPGLPNGIPITALCGDQQAALYGQACYAPGEMKNTYGTGCFLVMNTGKKKLISKKGLLTTMACDEFGKPAFALEGSVFIAGALVQWLRDSLKWIRQAGETDKIARSVPDSHGVTVVPAFVGLGAPYWNANARGAILGLTRGVKPEHIIRASLEAIALQTADLVNAIKMEFKSPIPSLKVDGGAAKNNFLMQFQADILGLNIFRSQLVESTAWGAAKLAGVGSHFWKSPKELDRQIKYDRFHPKMKKQERISIYSNWQDQVKRVL